MKNKELVELLIDKNYKITCAESCTGGLLASNIVEVPAASQVFDMSFVTYANEAKVQCLGVQQETIDTYGVVSEEVAREMAVGCAERALAVSYKN
ncbi:MAG: CinA family protein, partial [Anaeroplasmataceae bacterium]|nr:CinA family protein [Anaeroplasmataceae bacterium]